MFAETIWCPVTTPCRVSCSIASFNPEILNLSKITINLLIYVGFPWLKQWLTIFFTHCPPWRQILLRVEYTCRRSAARHLTWQRNSTSPGLWLFTLHISPNFVVQSVSRFSQEYLCVKQQKQELYRDRVITHCTLYVTLSPPAPHHVSVDSMEDFGLEFAGEYRLTIAGPYLPARRASATTIIGDKCHDSEIDTK